MRLVIRALVLVLVGGCGGAPAPGAPGAIGNAPAQRAPTQARSTGGSTNGRAVAPAPPTVPVPRATIPAAAPPSAPLARSDGTAPSDPALATAAAAYGRLLAAPFSLETAPVDTETGIHELIARIEGARTIAQDVTAGCYALERGSPPTSVAALVLEADALDVLASRVASATLHIPLDLAAQVRRASPEVQSEIDRVFHERIAQAIAPQARAVFCSAALTYERALAIDPGNARARAQIDAYGDAFVASCGP